MKLLQLTTICLICGSAPNPATAQQTNTQIDKSTATWDETAAFMTTVMQTQRIVAIPQQTQPATCSLSTFTYNNVVVDKGSGFSFADGSMVACKPLGFPNAPMGAPGLFYDQYTVNLAQIDPSQIKVTSKTDSDGHPYFEVTGQGPMGGTIGYWVMRTRDADLKISVQDQQELIALACDAAPKGKKGKCYETKKATDVVSIDFRDPQMAVRFAHALLHAVVLAGGQVASSPF